MNKSVFEYVEYKPFVLNSIAERPNRGRGQRARIAEAIQCQVAYVSHVLAGDKHFSLEQAEGVARYLGLRADETDFFLLLVEHERAGTPQLKAYFKRKMDLQREGYRQLKSRVGRMGAITSEDQATYYSSWHYQAVRMALTLPQCRTVPEIAKRLGLSKERVTEILSFFLSRGLVSEEAGKYRSSELQLHLPGDSPLISKLHSNWRIQTLQKLDRKIPDDLHYSSVVTLAEADYQKVREILVNALLQSHAVIKPSKEEKLCVLAMDFYEL